MCFVLISEQTAIISLYSINCLLWAYHSPPTAEVKNEWNLYLFFPYVPSYGGKREISLFVTE
jgi:hypothetical protein